MEEQDQNSQIQFLLSDFNTRLKDLEERNRLIRERTMLLGKNFISIKEEADKEIDGLKKQTNQMQADIEKIKNLVQRVIKELDRFVRKDEMLVIERMLKDFQPLEFVRMKDLKEIIKQKNIKTKKTSNKP